MADVSRPGYSEDAAWLRSLPLADRQRFLYPGQRVPTGDHLVGVRVGMFGISMQCQSCGTVATAKHEPMILTDVETGEARTIAGAWVEPPNPPYRHFFPFEQLAPKDQDDTSQQFATSQGRDSEAPAPRPAGISAEAAARATNPEHRKAAPSRSPEARRAERQRAKRRATRTRT
jgi:hypothetical protein